MARCPNLLHSESRDEFNRVLEGLGGKALRLNDVRHRSAYLDGLKPEEKSAYDRAHFLWDMHDGDAAAAAAHVDSVGQLRSGLESARDTEYAGREAKAREFMQSPEWKAAAEKPAKERDTSKQTGYGEPEWKAARQYAGGIKGWDAAVDHLATQAQSKVPGGYVGKDRLAYIVIGYPGAGKSTVADAIRDQFFAAHVTADDAKQIIPEYQGGKNTGGVHQESTDLAEATVQKLASEGGSNFIIETLGTTAVLNKRAAEMREAGYKVGLIHVDVPKAIAMERAVDRYKRDGRAIPEEIYDKLKADEVYAKAKATGAVDETAQVRWDEGAQAFRLAEASQGLEAIRGDVERARMAGERGAQRDEAVSPAQGAVGAEGQQAGVRAPGGGFPVFSFSDRPFSPSFRSALPEVRNELERQLANMAGDQAAIRVVDRLFVPETDVAALLQEHGVDPIFTRPEDIGGRTTEADEVVFPPAAGRNKWLMAVALEHGGQFNNVMQKGAHGLSHIFREIGLWDDAEFGKLVERAKKTGAEKELASRKADILDEQGNDVKGEDGERISQLELYKQRYEAASELAHPNDVKRQKAWLDEYMNQELVGVMVEDYVAGRAKFGGVIDELLSRIGKFFEALRAALNKVGITTLDQMLEPSASMREAMARQTLERHFGTDVRSGGRRVEPFLGGEEGRSTVGRDATSHAPSFSPQDMGMGAPELASFSSRIGGPFEKVADRIKAKYMGLGYPGETAILGAPAWSAEKGRGAIKSYDSFKVFGDEMGMVIPNADGTYDARHYFSGKRALGGTAFSGDRRFPTREAAKRFIEMEYEKERARNPLGEALSMQEGVSKATQPAPVPENIEAAANDLRRPNLSVIEGGKSGEGGPTELASFSSRDDAKRSLDLDAALTHAADALGIMTPTMEPERGITGRPSANVRQRVIGLANEGGAKLLDTLGPGFRDALEAHADELKGYAPTSSDPSGDGFLAFFRDFVAWPNTAKRRAPAIYDIVGDYLDAHNPSLLAAIEHLQDDSRRVDLVGGNTPPAAAGGGAAQPPDIPSAAGGSGAGPGRFGRMFRSYADRLHLGDIILDLQMKATPMAANNATMASRAVAKGFANALRLAHWEWQREDEHLVRGFTAGERERMWVALDEQSVAVQMGRDTTRIGLNRLDSHERPDVERLNQAGDDTWEQMKAVGMVEGEGLPFWAPRMLIRVAEGTEEQGARSLGQIGLNLKTTAPSLRHRKHLTAAETEAAGKALLGDYVELARDIRALPLAIFKLQRAIAARTLVNRIKEMGRDSFEPTVVEGGAPVDSEYKWFTIDNPGLKTFRPKLQLNEETGKYEAVKDEHGDTVMEKVPLFIREDFEGPLKAVLSRQTGDIYNALMSLKGKTMSVIMFSPLIHNAVEFGRAFPMMPGKMLTLRVYFEGNRAKNDPEVMQKAIEDGLVPIGHRAFNQDITSMMEEPFMDPGRSWTAKLAAAVPGLFSRKAGDAVKRSVDAMGDFWHNTMLWDRVGDLQMGLYVNMRDKFIAKGVDADTASKTAAHFANRYAGALPHEAMSTMARQIANLLMFSRSFTLGNIGAMKDVFVGLPRDVQAQINEMAGPEGLASIKSLAKRKAFSILLIDMGLLFAMNSLLQNFSDKLRGEKTWGQIGNDYISRFQALMHRLYEQPLEALNPFKAIERLSATSANEPGKSDRILVGYDKDGTAIYARNPFGKIGEEFIGYLTSPFDMVRRKMSTIARPIYQIMSNDKGFGRKLYDPYAETPADWAKNIGRIVTAIAAQQVPIDTIKAGIDLAKGREAGAEMNKLKILGPLAGVTFSKGAPGGPAAGILYRSEDKYHFRLNEALPDIRKMIQDGDTSGARAKMKELGVPQGLQDFYVRTTRDPKLRLRGRKAQDFKRRAEPEELEQYLDALRRNSQTVQ